MLLYGVVCSVWPFFTIILGPHGPWFVALGHGLAGTTAVLAAVALMKSSKRLKAVELLALDDDPRWTFFLLGICIDVWLCSATNESIQSAFIDLIYGLELPIWLEGIVVALVASSGVFYQLPAQYNAAIMLNIVLVLYPVLQFEDEMPADFQCSPTLMENFSRWKQAFLSLPKRFSISRVSEKFRSSGIVSILLLQAVNLRYLSCNESGQMSLYESECWDQEHTQFSLLFCALEACTMHRLCVRLFDCRPGLFCTLLVPLTVIIPLTEADGSEGLSLAPWFLVVEPPLKFFMMAAWAQGHALFELKTVIFAMQFFISLALALISRCF